MGLFLSIAMIDPREHKLRWYEHELRSLLILTTLIAFACSWYAIEMQEVVKRWATMAEIEKVAGKLTGVSAAP